MVAALLVKRPLGGWVESVVTVLTQRFLFTGDFCLDGMRPLWRGPRKIAREGADYLELLMFEVLHSLFVLLGRAPV